MQIILSPTKTQSFECSLDIKSEAPKFLDKTAHLIELLRVYTVKDLMGLMNISQKLAEQSYFSFRSWGLEHNRISPLKLSPAICAYKGTSFSGFELDSYSSADFDFANKHINILSGLYGVVSPLELIRSYRLELGLRWSFELRETIYKNLYDFWKEDVNNYLAKKISSDDVLLNLASLEYSKVIDKKRFTVVTVVFKTLKDKKLKNIGIYAKQQRGKLSNWIVKNKVEDVAEIINYSDDGFGYESSLHQSGQIVFVKSV